MTGLRARPSGTPRAGVFESRCSVVPGSWARAALAGASASTATNATTPRRMAGGYAAAPMRVAVVDMGSNSTRLLIAEVVDRTVQELDGRSIVTRLGQGVEAGGRLGDGPQQRVMAVLDDFTRAIEESGCERRVA